MDNILLNTNKYLEIYHSILKKYLEIYYLMLIFEANILCLLLSQSLEAPPKATIWKLK